VKEDHFGHYQILRTLAFGGMAQVLLARDEDANGRLVVLKQILPHLVQNLDFVRFFIHEGRLGQRLHHPNLVETLEAGDVGGTSYIALEYLHGRSVIDVLKRAANEHIMLPLGFVVRVVADAARGLHAAHEAVGEDGRWLNVIHRDVTPHNLFVCDDGGTKVLDFGIAKAASQLHQTRTGLVKGKFAYLSPEQIRGEPIDRRVDVFALGIVLYEMLTQVPLFRGTNDGDTLQRVLQLEVISPERRRVGLPPAFAAVTMRALQRDPERRLPSALALAEALEAVAATELVDASPAAAAAFLGQVFPELPDEDAAMAALSQATQETPAAAELPSMHLQTGSRARLERVARRVGWIALGLVAIVALALVIGMRKPPVAAVAAPVEPGPERIHEHAIPDPPRAAPPEPAAPALGRLVIIDERRPASLRVTVDGKVVDGGTGSAWTAMLPVGPHRVQVWGDGHSPRSFSIDVAADSPATMRVRAGRGRLRIAVTPWAEVSLDDTRLGVTPLQPVEAAEGAHVLTVVNADLGVRIKKKIAVQAGKETSVHLDLFKGDK
jgi:serine/threonine-protein kinase